MSYTLNGIDLGTIQSEDYNIDSDLDVVAFPMSNSKDTQAFDYSGVKRQITITGKLIGSSQQDLIDKCLQLDALQNGGQSTVIFHSDLLDSSTYSSGNFDYTNGNINVKVKNFDWHYDSGIVLKAEYTLTLYESI